MGCSGDITNLDDDDESQGKLMIRRYTGILFPNSNFVDTLIKSEDELNLKLRKYIPSRIKEENSDELIYNIKDDILTQSVKVDFENQYIIAINGINYVFRVEEEKNNYVVYHDNGVLGALSGRTYFDAFDCAYCGSQNIVGVRETGEPISPVGGSENDER